MVLDLGLQTGVNRFAFCEDFRCDLYHCIDAHADAITPGATAAPRWNCLQIVTAIVFRLRSNVVLLCPPRLSQSAGLTLRFEEAEDVVLTDCAHNQSLVRSSQCATFLSLTWSLDVADNATGGVVHELDADLANTSTRACILSDLSFFFLLFLFPIFFFFFFLFFPFLPCLGECIPVRPRTLMTFTSLTGTLRTISQYFVLRLAPMHSTDFAESIFAVV